MFVKKLIWLGAFSVTLASASFAMAQPVEVEATAPQAPPKFQILRPEAPGSEVTRRMGLAGWTSPVGGDNDHPQGVRQPGWLSFGFAITWGGPTPAERRATAK